MNNRKNKETGNRSDQEDRDSQENHGHSVLEGHQLMIEDKHREELITQEIENAIQKSVHSFLEP